MFVGVELPSKCVSNAWKALNLELAVNCQHISSKNYSASLEKYTLGVVQLSQLHTFAKLHLNGRLKKWNFFPSVKTKILASGFSSPSYQSYVCIFSLEFIYDLHQLGCIWKIQSVILIFYYLSIVAHFYTSLHKVFELYI
jgi:hypothetical protein